MLTRRIALALFVTLTAVAAIAQDADPPPGPFCNTCTKMPPVALTDGVAATWDLGVPVAAEGAPTGLVFAEKKGRMTEITVEATVPPAESNNYSIYIVDAGTGKALKEHRVKANRGTIRRTFKSDLPSLTIVISPKSALTEVTTAADVLLASAPQPPQ